jgi:hypothetical protein
MLEGGTYRAITEGGTGDVLREVNASTARGGQVVALPRRYNASSAVAAAWLRRGDQYRAPSGTTAEVIGAVQGFVRDGYELITLRHVDRDAPAVVVWLRRDHEIELVTGGLDDAATRIAQHVSDGFTIVDADYNGEQTAAAILTRPR